MLRKCFNCEHAWWELPLDYDQKAEDKADAEFAEAQAISKAEEEKKADPRVSTAQEKALDTWTKMFNWLRKA